ncbi:MAG: hypothetical protein R3185_04405 [Candidatus Thermoplasmatota archaeon]|nr:hypothetical protein [Candidatus Thermoplasmatota archaeon]
MVWGREQETEEPNEGLQRRCHICEKVLDSPVWYAKNMEEGRRKNKRLKRAYACPSCFFELPDDEREAYQRERS